MVSGGRATEAGPLGMKRELRRWKPKRAARKEVAQAQKELEQVEYSRHECDECSNASPPIMWKPTKH